MCPYLIQNSSKVSASATSVKLGHAHRSTYISPTTGHHHPCHRPKRGAKVVPNSSTQRKVLQNLIMCILVLPLTLSRCKTGRKCYVTPAFSGIPKHMGAKSEVATKSVTKIVPVSSIAPEGWGPKESGDATPPLHSQRSPNKGGQNQYWRPQPCFIGGPKEGGNAT